jgi:hypothetical protein
MKQTIKQCVDQGLALEQLVPVRVVEVDRDDRRSPGVTQIHELEEGVELLRLEGQVPELID